MTRKNYLLTPTARRHLREAKAWSRARWGNELTKQYFHDLEKAAQFIALNHQKVAKRQELTGDSSLCLYPVREHYIVYEPLGEKRIAIAAFIRMGRDIPTLLSKHAVTLKEELTELRKSSLNEN
ncbi:MAG: type II toxin-antitoxin system RelE/ParE family toxin [Moorea sp. SIO3I7]|uniref:type II toxin-antitoxin system RelE/ParE family toxin n=1 Tax=Moorena sp. SIO3I8 TaxID=2607833 RepID=UPI0013C10072|nr:type II toxin-antitoxin system RelE/ParE family toxin [Moorena sp. SIO3I8]NEN95733.1 type II toxin-antitoxin system RelE/ParE family toxin [Moorena sp. SIO3I7]NEO09567.1 type II toxin-antitoxin system RelE/ParE family toxin [Moorena sp. SIO3I8]